MLKTVAMALVSKRGRRRGAPLRDAVPADGRGHGRPGGGSTWPATSPLGRRASRAVKARGKAEPGDKTMVDALTPALAAMEQADDLDGALTAAVEAAETGVKDTIPLIARKGRASYLGSAARTTRIRAPPRPTTCFAPPPRRSAAQAERSTYGAVRGSARSGHHEHPLHDLRPRRQRGRGRAAGARADLSPSRAGSSTTRARSGSAPARSWTARSARSAATPTTSPRSGSRISARRRSYGIATPASPSTTRSSGRTRGPTRSATSCRPTAGRTASG